MPSITGVELRADACVLARLRRDGRTVEMRALRIVERTRSTGAGGAGAGSDEELAERLRALRRADHLPAAARVVAWTREDERWIGALEAGGFTIQSVISPARALATLAGEHPRSADAAAAWLALNTDRAAIAVVERGALLYSTEFAWTVDRAFRPHDELLRRYSRVAHLAEELRHAAQATREAHGASVGAIVTCGNLEDLRSLTMPLIEELDMEVEVLDGADGLDLRAGTLEAAGDKGLAGLRLVSAAALLAEPAGPRLPIPVARAAAVAGMAGLAWWAYSALGPRARPAESTRPRAADPVASVKPSAPAAPAEPASGSIGRGTPQRQAPPVAAQASRSTNALPPPAAPVPSEAASVPAGTAGRIGDAGPDRRGAALADPLPSVGSILIAGDRRLAVVDGAIVREGEAVGRRVLARIERGAIVLREPSGREVRVPLRPARRRGRAG